MTELLLTRNVANALCLAGEFAVILCLFRRRGNRPGAWRLAGFLPLLGIAYLYFTPEAQREVFPEQSLLNFLVQLGRMALYWASVFGYLAVRKDIRRGAAAYEAGFLTAVYLTAQNVRIILLLLIQWATSSSAYDRLSSYLCLAAECLLVAGIRRALGPSALRAVGGARWGMLSITLLLALYFKWSLMTMIARLPAQGLWSDFLAFAFCAALATLASLFLFELSQRRQERMRQVQLERVYLSYEMQNVRRARQAEQDMRRLYHDMKHHLLALRGMAEDGGRVERYLEELLPRFERYERQVSTGAPTVDTLLSEKIHLAAADGISFHVYLDLSPLKGVEPADLVSIFGNAVDNAVEAVRVLPPDQERLIRIKSTCAAGVLTLRFSNPFAGRRMPENGTLSTGKEDKALHGIGLGSIQKAARRCGGAAGIQIDNERGWFDLTVVLPAEQAP